MKEQLGCRYYLRYMDDFSVLHDDKQFLWDIKCHIQMYLAMLHLKLHEKKCRIFSTDKGMPFLGLIISSEHRRLKRENVLRFKRQLKKFQFLYGESTIEWKQINQSIQSWIGHAKHADTMRLRELILPEIAFKRVPKGD